MIVEKEVIAPGTYFYVDEASGKPRKLEVTPALTRYWHDRGNEMIGDGLPVPVPYEHDFSAHPMTPREKLLGNAGEVRGYKLRDILEGDPLYDAKRGPVRDALFGVVDVTDPDVKRKIGRSVRWTSPWINSFTDGAGKRWENVISHLALTTRPRVTKQAPFPSVAAALSLAEPLRAWGDAPGGGLCLSRAGRVSSGGAPTYPIAFSMWAGAALDIGDLAAPPKKGKARGKPGADVDNDDLADADVIEDEAEGDVLPAAVPPSDGDPTNDATVDLPPLGDPQGDVQMEELLCDLLQALGVPMPDASSEAEFKRHLYEAVMSKIKELTSRGMGAGDGFKPDQNEPPSQQPNASQPKPGSPDNPLIQQEQQPMYMSLEEINKLPDPLRGVALAMHNENAQLRQQLEATAKVTASIRDGKLRDAKALRDARCSILSRASPRVKADLDAMLAAPSMALSLGDGGDIVDPMAQTLALLEKGLADMPRLLTADSRSFGVAPHPTDGEMTEEAVDKLSDDLARMMGCPPERRAG